MNKIKAFVFLMLFSLILSFSFITAKAEDKEYTVDNASFEVFFDEDNGDATIVEEWDVNYIKGDFTRFYKDINRPLNQLEYYDDIDILKVSINGKESVESTKLDRVHNHYYFENSKKNIIGTMHWFYEASNETVHYKVVYNINNIVKINKDNEAVFCYRLIGDNFPKTVGNVSVTLHMDEDYIDDIVLSKGYYEFDSDTVVMNAEDVNGIYKVNVSMDPTYFDELIRVKDVKVPKTFKFDWDQFAIVVVFLPFVLFIVYRIFSVIISGIYKIIGSILINKNPNIFRDAAARIEALNLPYPIYMSIPKRRECAKNPYLLFYMQIFDLCRRNRAYINNDEIGVLYLNYGNNTFVDMMDQEFCKFLSSYSKFPVVNNYIIINFNSLKSLLAYSIFESKKFKKMLKKWHKTYKKNYKNSIEFNNFKRSGLYKSYKKDINLWYRFGTGKAGAVSLFETLIAYRRNGYIDTYMILSLITNYLLYYYKPSEINYYSDDSDVDIEDSSDYYAMCNNYYMFCITFDDQFIRSHSSNGSSGSGCSSCSSCSSCSGCGGGGAD